MLMRLQLAGFAMLGILQFDFDNHGAADLGVIIAFGVMVSFVVSFGSSSCFSKACVDDAQLCF